VEDDDLPRLPHCDCVARRIPDLVVALTALLMDSPQDMSGMRVATDALLA
jgi:hypothetical protein